MRDNYDNGEVRSSFITIRKIVISFIVITAIIVVATIITAITHPEVIGEFMGKIVNGFNSTIK